MSSSLACGKGRPREHVGAMEANHPWLVFDSAMAMESGIMPYGDKQDPGILYLVYTSAGDHSKYGDAVKINLSTKGLSPYHFNVTEWQDVKNYALKYNHGFRYNSGDGPMWIEFRGKREDRVVKHLFGDPVPNKLGSYKAELRTGYYYIMDERNKKPIELLRVKIANSEFDFGGLGDAHLSPDRKWIVFETSNNFQLYRQPSKTFIFNREDNQVIDFQTDHFDPAIEVWKVWGESMGTKP
jgi:hypothetical protein